MRIGTAAATVLAIGAAAAAGCGGGGVDNARDPFANPENVENEHALSVLGDVRLDVSGALVSYTSGRQGRAERQVAGGLRRFERVKGSPGTLDGALVASIDRELRKLRQEIATGVDPLDVNQLVRRLDSQFSRAGRTISQTKADSGG